MDNKDSFSQDLINVMSLFNPKHPRRHIITDEDELQQQFDREEYLDQLREQCQYEYQIVRDRQREEDYDRDMEQSQ